MEMRPFLRKNLSDTVKAELYEYIDNLDLDKGTKLPPENTIAQNYGVSRVTVRRALDELEQEGVIIRIHGRGTFVNPQAKQFKINLGVSQELGRLVDQSGYEMRICLTAVETAPADIIVAKALGIPAESKVICVERAYYADGKLAILCQDTVAEDIFPEPGVAGGLGGKLHLRCGENQGGQAGGPRLDSAENGAGPGGQEPEQY